MARRWTTANSNWLSASFASALGDQWTFGGWVRPASDAVTNACGGPQNIAAPDTNSPRLSKSSANTMSLQFGASGLINGATGACTVAAGWGHYLGVKRAHKTRSL